MNRNQILYILLMVSAILVLFLVFKLETLQTKNSELEKNISSYENTKTKEIQNVTCTDVLLREQKSAVKGYKFFTQCNFISGEYGDNDYRNVFGIENIKTGQKYIIGSKNGIFDQNTILDVIDERYVFLVNSYEGESRYIMIDTSESWPTKQALTNTVYPRTIDQYIKAKLTYTEIIGRF